MAKEDIHDLTKTMKQNIDEFYGNASVYRTNKYFVGFFGDYVKLAIDKMGIAARDNNKIIHGSHIYEDAYNNWKQLFYHEPAHQLDMRWACSAISIPHTSSKIETPTFIDSIKSIKYPIITSANDLGEIKITVRDDKHLMWYQFFNALNNCFYRAQILKPRSSFQKVSIYVAPIQEQFVNTEYKTEFLGHAKASTKRVYDASIKKLTSIENVNGEIREKAIDSVVSQVFEFNSAVLKDIAAMNLKNDSKEILEYNVTFAVPNTFQGSFNNAYKGLADNTSIGIDSKMIGDTKYNDAEFTIKNSESSLKTMTNGYYSDYSGDY